MNISYRWLRSILPVEASAEEVAHRLSVSGLEVEHIEKWESLPGGLKGFVVGEVLTCEKHPDADRLKVTTVNVGSAEPLHIVCGAPNVAAGQKVIVATVGSQVSIPGKEPFEIKKSKIRGQVSEGMICAEDEMGVGHSHDGILVLPEAIKVGISAAEYFGIVLDTVLEIGLTANRGDAASHMGVARDVAALYGLPLPTSTSQNITIPTEIKREVTIENSHDCRRYIGVTIEQIEVKDSPEWLKHSLSAIGIEPKNNVVDATNYILHHYGQPVHAFDSRKLMGGVGVRKAQAGEKITLLDDSEKELTTDDLVIVDESSPVALAGVMGGAESSVSQSTTSVFLEIAHFHESTVRKTAQRHVLNTDASFRFERGIDIENMKHVAQHLATLITDIAGGHITGFNDVFPNPKEVKKISFDYNRLNEYAGITYPIEKAEGILESLGFKVNTKLNPWEVSIPSWRNDVSYDVDLFEEVMRIYGFDEIPLTGKMQISLGNFQGMQRKKKENQLRNYLADKGYFEAQTNSLTSPTYYSEEAPLVQISNPLSTDMSVMRYSMVPGLLTSVAYNQNRQAKSVKLFELGKTYAKTENGYKETPTLCIVSWGNSDAETWESKTRNADFYDLKRVVTGLIQRMDSSLKIDDLQIESVSKKLTKQAEVKGSVWTVEIPLKKLFKPARKTVRYEEPSKFFNMRRDLSLVIDKKVQFKDLLATTNATKVKNLTDVRVFDIYEGKPLEEHQKAVSLSFLFNKKDAPMKDEEADKSMSKLMAAFEENGAVIRR